MVLLQAPCMATVSLLGLFFRVFMEKKTKPKYTTFKVLAFRESKIPW